MATDNVTVGIVGCGSMGGAIASGFVASGSVAPERVLVCDHGAEKLARIARESGVCTFPTVGDLLAACPDVVILAVKPQVLPALLKLIQPQVKGMLIVSIAAGVRLATLERALLPSARAVVRVMPNLPVSVRSGASAVAGGTTATADDVSLVRDLFAALGSAQVMREDQLDVEGAVVGCAPAYFALMVDAFTRASVRAGLPAAASRELLEATMRGTAQLLQESGDHPRAFMERVTSPGGTTAVGLEALEPLIVEGAYEAVDAALERTRELAGE